MIITGWFPVVVVMLMPGTSTKVVLVVEITSEAEAICREFVDLIFPFTSSVALGLDVPIPTFPPAVIRIFSVMEPAFMVSKTMSPDTADVVCEVNCAPMRAAPKADPARSLVWNESIAALSFVVFAF